MPGTRVTTDAVLTGWNWLGADCEVGAGARVEDSVLWAGAKIEAGAVVRGAVVREGMMAAGLVEGMAV